LPPSKIKFPVSLRHTTIDRIKQHRMECGYKFRFTSFKADANRSLVTVANFDAWICVNGVRSSEYRKFVQPGEERRFEVRSGGINPKLTIESDSLVPGQVI